MGEIVTANDGKLEVVFESSFHSSMLHRLSTTMQSDMLSLFPARRGHFKMESGHHGDLWLDLELLCLHPRKVNLLASELAKKLESHNVQMVCGPLVEGAYVALAVASELGLEFTYTERFENPQKTGLFPVEYRLPGALREKVRGRRVAIVNDVINGGSAVRGTYTDLLKCGAKPIVVSSLLVLGPMALNFATESRLALVTLESRPNFLWSPDDCPMCKAGVPLDN